MFSRYFWVATLERAVKSFAQSLLALLSAGQLGLLDVEWVPTLSTAGMVALLSLLTSLASSQFGNAQDPSVLASSPPREQQPAHIAAARPAP
jgi:hypothetical protein